MLYFFGGTGLIQGMIMNRCRNCALVYARRRRQAKERRDLKAATFNGILSGKVIPLFDSDPITGIHYRALIKNYRG